MDTRLHMHVLHVHVHVHVHINVHVHVHKHEQKHMVMDNERALTRMDAFVQQRVARARVRIHAHDHDQVDEHAEMAGHSRVRMHVCSSELYVSVSGSRSSFLSSAHLLVFIAQMQM